jgi:rhomboid family GlyGly-CTERM serine protease
MTASLWRNYRVTIIVSTVALLAYASSTLSLWLELDFSAVASGQWWRIWTGHLTHYDGQHLFWDLLMFAVLGAACERQHHRRFALGLALMMAGVSAAIALWCEEITIYRGLSGVDTGLFVWFVADQCRACWLERDRATALLWLVPGAALVAKLLYEATTGQMLFVEANTFTPLVESHLAGVATGFLCSCMPLQRAQETGIIDRSRTSQLDSYLALVPEAPKSTSTFRRIDAKTLSQREQGQHIMEAHKVLSEVPSDVAPTFRQIAAELKRELDQQDRRTPSLDDTVVLHTSARH